MDRGHEGLVIDSYRSARAIYDLLVVFSRHYCRELGISTDPGRRTRRWALGALAGVAYHYTGGGSFERSARWFNAPSTANTVSSCHVLIDDAAHDDLLGTMWRGEAGALGGLFPAPVVVLCPWDRGAWCTNWANGRCLGVELRNRGYLPRHTGAGHRTAHVTGGQVERYTAEQLAAALQIGRLAAMMAPDTWSDDYVLGHYSVSWTKRDPGPDFPIHAMRTAIASAGIDGGLPAWLSGWPSAGGAAVAEDDVAQDAAQQDVRGKASGSGWTHDLRTLMRGDGVPASAQPNFAALRAALWACGYNVAGLDQHDQTRTKRTVAMFQRCYNEGAPTTGALAVDGRCGSKTWALMQERARRGYGGERYSGDTIPV